MLRRQKAEERKREKAEKLEKLGGLAAFAENATLNILQRGFRLLKGEMTQLMSFPHVCHALQVSSDVSQLPRHLLEAYGPTTTWEKAWQKTHEGVTPLVATADRPLLEIGQALVPARICKVVCHDSESRVDLEAIDPEQA